MTEAHPTSYLYDHLALALAAGELGTWRWELATGVTRWDATMERLFGLEHGTFEGTYDAWVARLHPDDMAYVLDTVDRAIAEGGAYELEHRVVRPDGSVIWLHGRGMATIDDEGKVTGTIGCAGDITARKLLEIESERRTQEAERRAANERLQRQRFEFLDTLNDSALASTDHRDLMRRVTTSAVPQLGDWCAVYFIPEGASVPVFEVAHRDPAMVSTAEQLLRRFPFDPDSPAGVAKVIRTGEIEFVPDLSAASIERAIERIASPALADDLRAITGELRPTSMIIAPLRAKRGVVGAIQFVSAESGRRFDSADLALARSVAGRVAEALESTWLTDQQRAIAGTLQASLLPPRLPEVAGTSIAVRFWAAGSVTEVGGDFYDVFSIGDRRWAIVIGDVCGTGPNAAAVTVIARHTIRAAATHGAEHREVLDWVNEALHAGNRDLFCTAIYSTLEQLDDGSWRFESVAGGHPLPILVAEDGATSVIGSPGTLLGVLPTIAAEPSAVALGPGDTLILYTDGVTDVRPPFDLDPERVIELAVEATRDGGTADDIAARLGRAINNVLPIPDRHDDVALVVVRIAPAAG